MMLVTLTDENIDQEHICCAIADKKTAPGVALKKEWLIFPYTASSWKVRNKRSNLLLYLQPIVLFIMVIF